ncbi:DNA-processing protein DprA [Luteococcus sp. OSA5]|uniref:DNA-processing protein DprA n=1 Tax=Luteococcus sp. OSA5 TaxID=3401630 RepID=UPI003B42E34F
MNDPKSPSWDEERVARAALTAVCEAATPGLVHRVSDDGAQAVWQVLRAAEPTGRWARRAQALDVDKMLAQAARHQVRFVIPGDAEWPQQLEVLHEIQVAGQGGAPFGLWVRGPGQLAEWADSSVAIVGSRASTAYGDSVATDLALDLSAPDGPGWTVVSGGAYGIDAAAHRGVLTTGGRTVAVLAGGLDEPYPRGNARLFEQLAADHLLVSEVPCGMHPTRTAFLARNRLIAALTNGAIIVEAAARSGANNTISWAGECGRIVMAVPGPVHSSLSVTPHRLIRDQRATLVSDSRDVRALLEPLSSAPPLPVGGQSRELDRVPPELMQVREVLPGRGGLPTGQVAQRAGLPLAAALASLGQLEQLELARCDEMGEWHLARPARSHRVSAGPG